MKECLNFEQLEEDNLKCLTCSHFCTISPGLTGICGVRKNDQGRLYLLNYGKSPAVNIDPIEKKPLFHFLPGTFSLSVGTYGCNFHCGNCQNFYLSQVQGLKGEVEEYDQLDWGDDWPPEKLVEKALDNDCQSIAYTYNEPTIFLEYALETMKLARQKGLKNIWVSNDFMSKKTLETIAPFLDAINVDIKSFDEKFYQENCGGRLRPVLKNCQRIIEKSIWLEVTTLIIPTLTDNEEMLKNIAEFIYHHLHPDVPWHLSAFSPTLSWRMKKLPSTPPEKISQAYRIGKEVGLNYVYTGNIGGGEGQNTFCPKCKGLIIKRIGYQIQLPEKSDQCPSCAHPLPGIF